MSEPQDTSTARKQLDDIRTRLLANPSQQDLQSMQVQLDAMERLDRVTRAMMTAHDHDHMDDHDHTA